MQLLPNKRTAERIAAAPTSATAAGSGLAKGMEFAFLLVFFFGLGWLIDRALGTSPWMSLILLTFGVIGHFVRVWYAYDGEMKEHERRMFEGRNR